MSENKRLVQETSFLSYEQVRASTMAGDKRMVFEAIKENTKKNMPMTDYELSIHLGFENPNKIRPRRKELEKDGLVEEAEKRLCSISKKKAITWKTVSTLDEQIFKEVDGFLVPSHAILQKDRAWLDKVLVQRGYEHDGNGRWKKN